MWPDIESIVTTHATDCSTDRLILEGSALWPESVATLNLDNVAAIWLTASNDFFQARRLVGKKWGPKMQDWMYWGIGALLLVIAAMREVR